MPEVLFRLVTTAARTGDVAEAVRLAQSRDTRAVVDCGFHLGWADVLEELGLTDDAAQELNLALRDDPANMEIHPRLAELLLDQGRPEKAARVWMAAVKLKPQEARYYQELGSALREAREFAKARNVYEVGFKRTEDPKLAALLRELNFIEAEDSAEDQPQTVDAPEPLGQAPTQSQLMVFESLFRGRQGVHARQWISPSGDTGYTPVQETLTPNVIENHILGNYTVGIYPVRLDNTVGFIAFDFDIAKFAVAKAIKSRSAWEALMAKAHQTACRVAEFAAAVEIPVYIEDSGFKGRHVWLFIEVPIPAGVAKKCGETILKQIGGLPPEIAVEVFPKQGAVKRGGLGNLIKLPLGIHKRTGRRGLFVTPEGSPCPDQLRFLEEIRKTPRRVIYALIQKYYSLGGVGPAHTADDAPPWSAGVDDAPVDLLPKAALDYHPDTDPQFQAMLLKCGILGAVVEKVNREGALTRDETQVLIHTVGHLDQGPEAVNFFFRRCPNMDPGLFMKSKLTGNPMSCPKIRSRLPQVSAAVKCSCSFHAGVGLYPNPLNHLHGTKSAESAMPVGIALDSLQFQNLLQEYLKLSKQLRETRLLLDQYEAKLQECFENAGVEVMETPAGKLKITKSETGVSFQLEI